MKLTSGMPSVFPGVECQWGSVKTIKQKGCHLGVGRTKNILETLILSGSQENVYYSSSIISNSMLKLEYPCISRKTSFSYRTSHAKRINIISHRVTVLTHYFKHIPPNIMTSKLILFHNNLNKKIWQTPQVIICHQNYYNQIDSYSNSASSYLFLNIFV